MKERPMIFNAEMVRAILDGRKTQTRRIVKLSHESGMVNPVVRGRNGEICSITCRLSPMFCPFGQPGDRIWVRETFQGPLFEYDLMNSYCKDPTPFEKPEFCVYKADGEPTPEFYDADDELHCRWRPSIHMPRWASRITLEITGVRVERLNSISQEDAQAEGMKLTGWRPTYSDPDSGGEVWTPYDNFAQLWESIYGEESWQANPWVWAITFRHIEGGAA